MNIIYFYVILFFISLILFIQIKNYNYNSILNINLEKNNSYKGTKFKLVVNPQYINKRNDNENERNVVAGILAIYNYTVVEPFFKSLRKTGYEGEIICFTLDKSLYLYEKMFEKYNIKPILFSKTHPYYLSDNENYPLSKEILKNIPIIPNNVFFLAILRFYLLQKLLLEYSSRFDYILTCDLRDSLFQRNPFDWNYKKGIYFAQESQHCKYYEARRCSLANRNWFFNLKPPKHLLNNTFINAGQIFGSSNEMRDFLKEYTEMMYNLHLKNKRRVDTCDQGILNWYVYTKNEFIYPLYLFEAEHGYVRVLGLDLGMNRNNYQPNENFTIINQDNTIPVVVHQYITGLNYGTIERKRKYVKFYEKYVN